MLGLLALLAAQQSPMPLAYTERPLTVPEDSFALDFELGGSQLDARAPVVFGVIGARYGHTDDLEFGVRLLRLSVSPAPGTGLNNPTGFVRYRFLSGVVELAGLLESEIPVGGIYEANARVELLLRLGPVARIDVTPEIVVFGERDWRFGLRGPVQLAFQLGEHLTLSAVGVVDIPNIDNAESVLGRAGGRLAWTFGDEGKATAELGLTVTTPNLVLNGERPENPAWNNYFMALLDLRWFLGNSAPDGWQGFDR